MNYWIICSKRKPDFWKPSGDDYYDMIWATKEDAESTLTEKEKRYYFTKEVVMKFKDKK